MRTALCATAIPVLVLCTAFVSSPARGQAPAPEGDGVSAATPVDSDTLDRRRLLTLDDGRVLRARSRCRDGAWEQRVGKDWVRVPGHVIGVRLERDVVAEARAMGAGLGRDDTSRRVVFAQWLAQSGLFPEAIAELDRVLRIDPEHAGALRLIAETPIELQLAPEALASPTARVRAVIQTGASGSPATREVAVRRLAELARFVDLRELVKSEMTVPQNQRRELAALAARRLFTGELLRELSARAMLDTFRDVRAEAAFSLAAAEDVAVIAPAINALNSKYLNVRANAAEALGNIGHAAAVEPLANHLAALRAGGASSGTRANVYIGLQKALVTDFDVEIAQGASIADPIVTTLATGVVFDVRSTVQMTTVVEMRAVMGSLRQLTGQRIGDAPDAWLDWWDENSADWRSLDRAGVAPPATGGSGE